MKKHAALSVGLLMLLAYLFLALFGLTFGADEVLNLELRLEAPSSSAVFGRDENGQALLQQILRATSLSVSISLIVVTLSFIIGVSLGILAGQKGGKTDSVLMRGIEVLQAFPNFLLALGVLSFLGPSYFNLVLAMTLTTWTGFARLIRGEVLHLKHLDFVQASKGFGATDSFMALKHLLPQVLGIAFVHASYTSAGVVIAEAGLSFLGVGLPVDIPSWGQLIHRGRPYLSDASHIVLIPSLFLAGYTHEIFNTCSLASVKPVGVRQ